MAGRGVLSGVVAAAMVAAGLAGVDSAAWAAPAGAGVGLGVAAAAGDGVPGLDGVSGRDGAAGVATKDSYASDSMITLSAEQSAAAGALYTAQRDNRQVPIPAFTSETSQAWARPDGSIHEESAAAPVRVKVAGTWQGVDATLVKARDGSWRPKVSAIAMVFSGGGSGPMATLTREGVSVAYTWPEALPTPVADGPRLIYPQVYPGVDLVLTATGSTFSQVLVIKDKKAAQDGRVRSFTVATKVTGGALQADERGGYVIKDVKGQDVLSGAAPLAWDSTSNAGDTGKDEKAPLPEAGRPVGLPAPGVGNTQKPMALKVEGGGLVLNAPVELLDDPGTTFPVALDPTVGLSQTRWFMVDSAYPSQQYPNYVGSAGSAWGTNEAAGYNSYAGVHVKRLFFEFNNSRLVGKNITYATFNAFQAFAATCDAGAGNNAYVLNTEIATPVTWNSAPTNLTQAGGTYTGKTNPSVCNKGKLQAVWDVTAALKARQSAGAATTTVALKGSNEGSNSSWQRWLDPTTGVGSAPMLAVDYTYEQVPALADLSVPAPGVGVQSWYGMEEFPIRENLSLGVNVANGNVAVRDADLRANAPGVGARLDRWYNSLSQASGVFGAGWKLGMGSDVRLVEDAAGTTVYFVGPSGFISKWTNSAGTWLADPGLNASLRKWSDGTYSLTAQDSHYRMDFGSTGMLGNAYDNNGVGLGFLYKNDASTAGQTLPAKIVDFTARTIEFTYSGGRVATITQTGSDGSTTRATSYGYDASGRLASSTDADNHTTSYTYGANSKLASITTAQGVRLEVGYDPSGRATSVSRFDAGGAKQTWAFNYSTPTQTVQTDAMGGTWIYTLDGAKKVTSLADPYRNKRSRTYSPNNATATSTDAMGSGGTGGNVTTFSWDTANNPTQVKMPTGASTSSAYGTQPGCGTDASGAGDKATCTTDAAGNKTGRNWDAAGNLTSATQGSGATGAATTSYTYQASTGATGSDTACAAKKGQVCTSTDPKGWKQTYGYDTQGNLTSLTPANTALVGARTFTYDPYGRVKTSTDGTGATLTYSWDNRDHLTGITGAKTVSYSWDGDGNQTSNDGATLSYDTQNRQTSLSIAGKTTSVSYDKNGNLASYTDDTGATTTYTTFWHNQVASISIDATPCGWGRDAGTAPGTTPGATPGCVKFAYNNNGSETSRAYPGGVIQGQAYDTANRTTAISSQLNNTGPLLTSQGYGYTKNGTDQTNVQSWATGAASMSPGPANGATQTFAYDSLNRVTNVTETGATAATWAYGYDPMGNRTTTTRTGATGVSGNETATYNTASQLTSNTHGAFTYDKNGNETSAPALPGSGIPARSSEVTDPIGNTTAMNVAGTGLAFTYGGTNPGQYNQLLTAHGTTYTRSILGRALSTRTEAGTTIRYITHPNGTNIGYLATQGQAWYLTDRLGSLIALASGSGALIARYSYDPYGLPRASTETNPLAAHNIHRYHGGLLDKTTGLTRYGVRWYNPATGRYTTPDPSGQEQNPYLYAAANPCNNNDVLGESAACGWLGVGASIGFAAATKAAAIPLTWPWSLGAAAVGGLAVWGITSTCEEMMAPKTPSPPLRRLYVNPSTGIAYYLGTP